MIVPYPRLFGGFLPRNAAVTRHLTEDERMNRPLRTLAAMVMTVCVASTLVACTSQDDNASTGQATPTNSRPDPDKPSTKQSKKLPSKTVSRAPDPLASKTVVPVPRKGAPSQRLSAPPAAFDQKVTYPDGVELEVTDIKDARVTNVGPGVVQGPTTRFSLMLNNQSEQRLDLRRVVVTAVYGDPARVAKPVYDDLSRDFSKRVKPTSRARATYTFMIPRNALDDVSIHVDFDGAHTVATFTGSTR